MCFLCVLIVININLNDVITSRFPYTKVNTNKLNRILFLIILLVSVIEIKIWKSNTMSNQLFLSWFLSFVCTLMYFIDGMK